MAVTERPAALSAWNAKTLLALTGLRRLASQHDMKIDCERLALLGWTAQDLTHVANEHGFRITTVLADAACAHPTISKHDMTVIVDLFVIRQPHYEYHLAAERVRADLDKWVALLPDDNLLYPALTAGLSYDEATEAVAAGTLPDRDTLLSLAALLHAGAFSA